MSRPGLQPRAETPGGRVELRFKIPKSVYDRLMLLVALAGEQKVVWLTRQVSALVEDGLRRFPVHIVWLRPGATIYSVSGRTYTPIAKAAGGERAWPIEMADLPRVISPSGQGWRCDITTERGGYEGRSVFVAVEEVVGQEPPMPPG